MQPLNSLETIILTLIFVGAASLGDISRRTIPNALVLTGLVIGLGLSILNKGLDGLLLSMAGFCLGFVMLLPGYLLRFTGAGDVKLFATMGVMTGPVILLQIFVVSILIGACLVSIRGLISYHKTGVDLVSRRYKNMLQTFFVTGQCAYVPPEQGSLMSQRLPMAPIFAAGAIIIFAMRYISF